MMTKISIKIILSGIVLSILSAGCGLKVPYECINGQTLCRDNYLHTCQDNEWVIQACGSPCDKEGDNGKCELQECQNDGVSKCLVSFDNEDGRKVNLPEGIGIKYTCTNSKYVFEVCKGLPPSDPCDVTCDPLSGDDINEPEGFCLSISDLSGALHMKYTWNETKYHKEPCPGNYICDEQGKDCVAPPKDIEIVVTCTNGYAKVEDPANPDSTIEAYCIDSADKLKELRDAVNSGDSVYPTDGSNLNNAYVLSQDIEIDGSTWTPIGTKENPFKSKFIGSQKIITMKNKMTANAEANGATGLFGYISNTFIKDLNVSGHIIINDYTASNIGILAGNINSTTIDNVSYTGTIQYNSQRMNDDKQKGNTNIGGLIGYAEKSIIKNSTTFDKSEIRRLHRLCDSNNSVYCVSIETLNAGNVGGMVGQIVGESKLTTCRASTSVKNDTIIAIDKQGNMHDANQTQIIYATGGLVGKSASTIDIENVLVTTKIFGGYPAGGILGRHGNLNGNGGVTIDNAHVINSEIIGNSFTGGIVGIVYYKPATIKNSSVYSSSPTKTIKGGANGGNSYISGIAGGVPHSNINISNSFVSVPQNSLASGFVGSLHYDKLTITNSFHIGPLSGSIFINNPDHNSKLDFSTSYHFGNCTSNSFIAKPAENQSTNVITTNVFANCNTETETNLMPSNIDNVNIDANSTYGNFSFSSSSEPIVTHFHKYVTADEHENILTNDNKSLIKNLGDAFILCTCKVDIGDGVKDYQLPILKDNIMEGCTCP